jgi:hypothetical protein
VLIDNLLNASGSRREESPALVLFGERKVWFVAPFRARSRLEGMLWRGSSSLSIGCLEVGVWGSGV